MAGPMRGAEDSENNNADVALTRILPPIPTPLKRWQKAIKL